MKKIIYAYWRCYEWQTAEEGRLEILPSPREFALEDFTFLGEFTITMPKLEVPSQVRVNQNRIKYLEVRKAEVQAEALVALKDLDDEIKNLLELPA